MILTDIFLFTDMTQSRIHFSRESSHPPHDSRHRCSESPKKTPTAISTPSRKPLERRLAVQGGDTIEDEGKDGREDDENMESDGEHYSTNDNGEAMVEKTNTSKKHKDTKDKEPESERPGGDGGVVGGEGDLEMERQKQHITSQSSLGIEGASSTIAAPQVKDTEKLRESLDCGIQPYLSSEGDKSVSQTVTETDVKRDVREIQQGTNVDENGGKGDKNQHSDEAQKEKLSDSAQEAEEYHTMSTNQEGEGETGVGLVSKAGDTGHRVLTDTQRAAKEPTHRLSLPLNELVRYRFATLY